MSYDQRYYSRKIYGFVMHLEQQGDLAAFPTFPAKLAYQS